MKISFGGIENITVTTPCDLRAEIYKEYLSAVYLSFSHRQKAAELLIADFPKPADTIPDDPRVNDALHDVKLLEALASILDNYVVIGVAQDLAKWRKVAYGGNPSSRPAPPKDPPAEPVPVDFLDIGRGLAPDEIGEKGEDELKKAYQDYFALYIARQDMPALPVTQHSQTMSGVEAFYRRYPLIRHAVTTCARNFRDNIVFACQRVIHDWDAVGNVFFSPGRLPVKLTKIKTSGSDTHKGGKQVLFLTFQRQDGSPGQLVYKPSDVEMDYRLVGSTANTRDRYGLGSTPSLTELVNAQMNAAVGGIPLPTYRILPRNHGSTLVEEGDAARPILPIYKSYGYIEFLTHEPPADVDGKPRPTGTSPGPFDWITDNEEDIRKFYFQWGELIALCSVFSLCDIHCENVIVHGLQPYLIDLENCFAKPNDGFDGSLIEGMKKFTITDRDSLEKVTGEGTVNLLLLNPGPKPDRRKPTPNQIVLRSENGPAMPEIYSDEIALGLDKMLGILKEYRAMIQPWLENIKNCVARSVIFPTTEYYTRYEWVYFDAKAKDPSFASTKGQKFFVIWKEIAENSYKEVLNNKAVLDYYRAWPSIKTKDTYTSAAPIYALQTEDNDFQDYSNCDIPSYYHRLNSLDLLNARGQKVNVNTGAAIPPLGRTTYFPETTWSIVCRQFNGLSDINEYIGRLTKCLDQILHELRIATRQGGKR